MGAPDGRAARAAHAAGPLGGPAAGTAGNSFNGIKFWFDSKFCLKNVCYFA